MPLYDYQCQQCTNGFTELRRSSEMDTQIDCPECGTAGKQYVLSVLLQLAEQCRGFLPSQHHQEAHSVEQATERTDRSV